MKNLKEYRKEFDKINNEILNSVSKRMKLSKKLGIFKKKNNLKRINREREKEMIKNLEKKAKKLGLDKKFINDLFKPIILHSRKVQK